MSSPSRGPGQSSTELGPRPCKIEHGQRWTLISRSLLESYVLDDYRPSRERSGLLIIRRRKRNRTGGYRGHGTIEGEAREGVARKDRAGDETEAESELGVEFGEETRDGKAKEGKAR